MVENISGKYLPVVGKPIAGGQKALNICQFPQTKVEAALDRGLLVVIVHIIGVIVKSLLNSRASGYQNSSLKLSTLITLERGQWEQGHLEGLSNSYLPIKMKVSIF